MDVTRMRVYVYSRKNRIRHSFSEVLSRPCFSVISERGNHFSLYSNALRLAMLTCELVARMVYFRYAKR